MNQGGVGRPSRRMGRRMDRSLALAMLAVGALALAACGGGQSIGAKNKVADAGSPYGFKTVAQDTSAPITVWVDSTRLPAAQAYQKAFPDKKINVVSYDGDANGSNSFKTKFQLYDRANSGWPDVVFTADDNAASWGSLEGTGDLAPVNKGLVPTDTLNGFAKGSLDVCTVNNVTYCLRNDLAQNVLWYNKKLMDQWGYTVPTTWEQYEQLADQVATQHPGYIVGTAGDAWAPEIYMWGAECPANQVTSAKSITVNTSDQNCVKAAKMMDSLIANKTMSTLSLFGSEFVKAQGSKVLMMPGPAWYGGAVFQGTIKTPKGHIAVAPALSWQGQNPPATGDVGGGAWWISSHSKNLKAAEDFATWVTTSDAYQADLAPGYPAFTAAATKWLATQQASGYWANDIGAPIQAAASQVWSGWGSAAFSQEAIWAKVVQAGMTQGKTIESLLPAWQTEIENEAKVLGYTVSAQ
jgi:ABC-type glycerol-3-phosphate transport system substrate-binding protein